MSNLENQPVAVSNKCNVYRKTIKVGGRDVIMYGGTLSDGCSVSFNFKCPITLDSPAFTVSNVVGNSKVKNNVGKDGKHYVNYVYFVTSADFEEIEGAPLPL